MLLPSFITSCFEFILVSQIDIFHFVTSCCQLSYLNNCDHVELNHLWTHCICKTKRKFCEYFVILIYNRKKINRKLFKMQKEIINSNDNILNQSGIFYWIVKNKIIIIMMKKKKKKRNDSVLKLNRKQKCLHFNAMKIKFQFDCLPFFPSLFFIPLLFIIIIFTFFLKRQFYFNLLISIYWILIWNIFLFLFFFC